LAHNQLTSFKKGKTFGPIYAGGTVIVSSTAETIFCSALEKIVAIESSNGSEKLVFPGVSNTFYRMLNVDIDFQSL
jgi:hypothetical protein